jgi:hypothetical protein
VPRAEAPSSEFAMNDLRLVQASRVQMGGHTAADDFDVVSVETGLPVGRIYARVSIDGMGREWWWGFVFPYTINAKEPYFGLAESIEGARQAFAERWQTILPNAEQRRKVAPILARVPARREVARPQADKPRWLRFLLRNRRCLPATCQFA